jgi:uncharacterized protein
VGGRLAADEAMSEPLHPFHIMAKPVCGICNLDCRYCYYTMKPRELYPGVRKFLMPEEVLESYTRQYLAAMPDRCEFGWQGGEPMLAGKDFYRKALALQRQFRQDGQAVANAFQTNGTLIDEAWCDLYGEGTFLIGISLDGPAQVHDAFRLDHAGRPSFDRAWKGLELLQKRGVEYNVLATLNRANVQHGANIYRFFVNRGVQYIQFIPILERVAGTDEPTAFSCGGEAYGRFLLEMFEQWSARDVGRVSVRDFDDVIHTILFGHAATCCHSERCAAAHVLEWNGDLYACDHFVYREWRLGNVMETPLEDLVRSPRLEEFARLKTDLPETCRDCEFLAFCHAGCPKHHRPIGTDPKRWNHFCEGMKMFYGRTLDEFKRIAEYIRAGRLPPMKEAPLLPDESTIRVTPGAMPAKVRRNDPCPCGSGRKFKHCCGRA